MLVDPKKTQRAELGRLTRRYKEGDSIRISGGVALTICESAQGSVLIRIEAPKNVGVMHLRRATKRPRRVA